MAQPPEDPFVDVVTAASEADTAARLFHSLFRSTIAESAAKPYNSTLEIEDSEDIPCISKLEGEQAETVLNAWGHLNNTKSTLETALRANFSKRAPDELYKLCLNEIYRLRKLLLGESKKNALLKDLLVNELNRSEAVEGQLSNTNDVINTMTSTIALVKRKNQTLEDEHRRVKARLARLEESGAGGSGQSVDGSVATTDEDNEPEPSYIGRYIYKSFPPDGHFVGFVVSFKKPYYRVVYEDGDMEDMVRKEVLHFWVSDSNLSAQKKILCQRTAKKLMLAPAVIPPKQHVQLK